MAFRYPEHPNTNRVDPFQDEQGRNPFADATADESETSENVYAASAESPARSYRPGGYETMESGRGRLLLLLGGLGFLAVAPGSCGVLAAFLVSEATAGAILSAAAGPILLGGAACWAAWLLARYDLAAMRAGAMRPDTERKTRWAHRLGAAGALLAVAPIIVLIVAFVRAIIEEF